MNSIHDDDARAFSYVLAVFASIRVASGVSRQALADLAGISAAEVERIESGSADIRMSSIRSYVRVLGGKITFEIGEPDGLQ